jgi:CTP synthase
MGIQPDVIVCRADQPVPQDVCDKVALFCDVEKRAVIPMPTMSSIYQVPLVVEEAGLTDYVIERLRLTGSSRDLTEWREMVHRLLEPSSTIEVALVGKYVELQDAYLSVKEALIHAGIFHDVAVRIRWVHSQQLEEPGGDVALAGVDGIIVPGGFGERGIEGKIVAARYAREHQVPYLGLCLGMQVMVVEFARNVLQLQGANSTEFDQTTPYPVISLLSEQLGVEEKGGTMRLGYYPCLLKTGTKARRAYGVDVVAERHRHRYEFNNRFRQQLEDAGLIASGLSPDGALVEICELRGHPFMVGSQFHPELMSRPMRPHPLFRDFVSASKQRAQSTEIRNNMESARPADPAGLLPA